MKSKDLEKRLLDFTIRVLRFVKSLPRTDENRIYGHQVIRSSSSIGANYAEATCALTRKDFTHDINKSRKEARETNYWLKIISETNPDFTTKIKPLIDESEQIVKIFQASMNTVRKNNQ